MATNSSAAAHGQKRIHSLVVDTGPLIKNEPALSTLIAQAEEIYTIPSVLSEIKVSNECAGMGGLNRSACLHHALRTFPHPASTIASLCFRFMFLTVDYRMKQPVPEFTLPYYLS